MPTRSVPAGIILILFDAAFVAGVGWMMWWNAGTSVADLSGLSIAMTIMVGGVIVAVRQLLSPRSRFGVTDIRAIGPERILTIGHLLITAAVIAAWFYTGSYLLGWFATFAVSALLTGNLFLLLSDIVTKVVTPSRSRSASAVRRRLGTVEVLHALTCLAGFGGLFLTAPVHQWDAYILNVTLVLAAATITAGSLAAYALRDRTIGNEAQTSID